MKMIPEGHKEIFVKDGEILFRSKEDFSKCVKGEWKAISKAWNITFNDIYVTWTDSQGGHYEELNGRYLTVFSKDIPEEKEETDEPVQITFFDLLEE